MSVLQAIELLFWVADFPYTRMEERNPDTGATNNAVPLESRDVHRVIARGLLSHVWTAGQKEPARG